MSLETIAFLMPFLLLGIAIIFVAFSGGPGRARQTYLTKGGRSFRFTMLILYVALGVAVPALVIADRDEAVGGTPQLRNQEASAALERGKELFRQTCATCHALAAANARGVTGPNLDEIGEMTPERVLSAIENGGTGQNQMPAGLLQGEDAEAVARYLNQVAGE